MLKQQCSEQVLTSEYFKDGNMMLCNLCVTCASMFSCSLHSTPNFGGPDTSLSVTSSVTGLKLSTVM